MNHVFDTMGTVVSVALAPTEDPEGRTAALDSVARIFDGFDARFSLYQQGSELSAVARGELPLSRSSMALRDAYAEALDWRQATGGAFTPHRPDGIVDLNGIVKALALESAGQSLTDHGYADWCINAGGDVLTSGRQAGGKAWVVGIVDPADRLALLFSAELSAERPAIATSGGAERGDHIWTSGGEPVQFSQVTVRAADIRTADALATAIIAGGGSMRERAASWPVDILTVDLDGELSASPGMRSAFAG